MANKITNLTAVTTPTAGGDVLWIEQAGIAKKITMTELGTELGGGSDTPWTENHDAATFDLTALGALTVVTSSTNNAKISAYHTTSGGMAIDVDDVAGIMRLYQTNSAGTLEDILFEANRNATTALFWNGTQKFFTDQFGCGTNDSFFLVGQASVAYTPGAGTGAIWLDSDTDILYFRDDTATDTSLMQGGGATTLDGLTDTNLTTPGDASLLIYDTGTATWRDQTVGGDGSMSDTGSLTVNNNSHTHDDTTIDGLNASAITAGTFGSSRVAALDAGDTTTGTFGTGRIPSLATSKITSGTFADARISSASVTQHLGDYANWTTSGQNDAQMTIGTGAATGGANGDIHFRYV